MLSTAVIKDEVQINKKNKRNMRIIRGDIYYANLGETVGSEQDGIRPVLVIQNDIGNRFSPTVIVTAITSQINKAKLPTHVELKELLKRDSVILTEQIRTIDKARLQEKITTLADSEMKRIEDALLVSLGFINPS